MGLLAFAVVLAGTVLLIAAASSSFTAIVMVVCVATMLTVANRYLAGGSGMSADTDGGDGDGGD